MASNTYNLNTWSAKRIFGDTNVTSITEALLQLTANNSWILSSNRQDIYGIKYVYDSTNNHDKIELYGGYQVNNANTPTAWIQLDTGDTYILGKLGINDEPDSYYLYVNGNSYFNGNTTHNGIDYFADGTTYYIDNSAEGILHTLTLDNMLILDNGSVNGELIRIVGVSDKYFSFKLTSPSGQTEATNVDIGWDWTNGDGAGAAFRSSSFPNAQGYFVIYARKDTTAEYALVGRTDGYLTWRGNIIPNTGNGTGSVGGVNGPVYVDGGVITACTTYANAYVKGITPVGTTAQFWRGDNAWSNSLTGDISIGSRGTTSGPSSITYSNRITIVPYFHTGGPWYIKSGDDASNAYLALYYNTTQLMRIKHDGTQMVDWKGNANTASKWASARTLTIGATGKSVDGSGNVSWSKAEILGSSSNAYFYRGDQTWSATLANTFTSTASPGFTNSVSAGSWAYLRLNNGSQLWDIATKSNTNDGALDFRPAGGDTGPYISRSGHLFIRYKSGTWVNSLTNSAITITDTASSYGGWICGPTKDGRIAISTYQADNNNIYLGYGERGRTTNSFTQSIRWDGASNILYLSRMDCSWLRIINDSSNNSDDAMIYIQNQTANDWAVKIVKGGKDYGLRVDSLDQGNAIWTNGYVRARCVWANQGSNGERQVGVDSGTSGTLYLWSNTTDKGLYSSTGYKTGYIIRITSSATTFYGNVTGSSGSCTGNAATATNVAWTGVTGRPTIDKTTVIYQISRGANFDPIQSGYFAGMSTSTGITSNWWHILSMDWSGDDKNNWISQLALPTENRTGVYYRSRQSSTTYAWKKLWTQGESITNAVWNDYAECRIANTEEPGRVLTEMGNDTLTITTDRLSHFAGVSSDTWGFLQGKTEDAKTPIAVAGRALVYPYRDRNEYKPGDCVCAAPNGTVDIMTREEIIQYPDRIVGIVSCVPDYEEWGGSNASIEDRPPIKVNGRIWIKVR